MYYLVFWAIFIAEHLSTRHPNPAVCSCFVLYLSMSVVLQECNNWLSDKVHLSTPARVPAYNLYILLFIINYHALLRLIGTKLH